MFELRPEQETDSPRGIGGSDLFRVIPVPGLGNHLSPLNGFHTLRGRMRGSDTDRRGAEIPEAELSHSPPTSNATKDA